LVWWESFKDTKFVCYTHIISWWSWWESHPCLKSYWTTSWGNPQRFRYIYNNGFGNWSRKCNLRPLPYWKSFLWRTMRLSLYFDTKNLRSANFSRIVITILVYAIEFHLLNERDLIATLAHNIPTSETLREGVTLSFHSRSFHYLRTTLPTWECLGSNSCGHKLWHHLYNVASTTM
jgi:hypothetical protein